MEHATRALHRIGTYRERAAPAPLARFIDVLWEHRAPRIALAAYPGYLVAPEPALSLCFACQRDNHGNALDPELLLIGPIRRSRAYLPPPGRTMVALRIHPEWSRALLGVDPRDHVDALDDFAMAEPRGGPPLAAALAGSASSREAFGLLVAFVERQARAARADGTELLVNRALRHLRTSPSPDAMSALAERLDISPRHLRRVVTEACGVAPRDYARLERFRGVLRDADATEQPRWLDLAARHGYADQSHLTREARRLTGLPAGRLHAERRRIAPLGTV